MIKGILFLFLLSSILSILFVNTLNCFYILLFILLIIYAYKKTSFKPTIAMFFVFIFFVFYKPNSTYHMSTSYKNYKTIVYESCEKYCILKYEEKYFLLYNDVELFKNDIISFEANLKKIKNDSSLFGFEFKTYLNNKRVFYEFENVNNLKIIKRNQPVNQKITFFLTSKLKGVSKIFISMLLFNDKNIDSLTYNNLKQINALHLFVVSGLHFVFLFKLFNFIFSIVLKEKAKYPSLLILFFYLYLLDFSISALRAFLCLLLKSFDIKKKLNSLDYLSISGIFTLCLEPLNVFNISFVMSYILTFVLTLSKNILKNKTSIQKSILTGFISFLTMLPIQLSLNYKINFLSFFINILLGNIILFYCVFCILSLIFSFVNGNIFSFFYDIFLKAINYMGSNASFLIFGKPKLAFFVIYYLLCFLLFLSLEKINIKQFVFYLYSLVIILVFFYKKNSFICYEQVTFLDVYQGDCTIIESKWGQGVMLIDTGGIKNYDIASKKIIPYLEYKGIKEIDVVVISHDDYDHCGSLSSLKRQMIVKKIVSDPSIKEVNIGSISLKNINIFYKEYDDTNNKSIVLYGKIANAFFLFTGDIDSSVESKIINKYPDLPVDILKVAHHGSKYSTSSEFIKHIKPKIAIISVGRNFYGHPTKEVLNILKTNNVNVYRTDIHGSIYFCYKYSFYYLQTAK